MQPEKIEGAHVEVGREQGFVPLWLRFEIVTDSGTGQTYPSMVCQFKPTQEEKVKIALGEPITLRILGIDWPPVVLQVGDVYDKDAAEYGVRYVQHVMAQRRAEAQAQQAFEVGPQHDGMSEKLETAPVAMGESEQQG